MDLERILSHYREHGAQKTYLAQHCELQLPTGQLATVVYVLPKYVLSLAETRSTDMQAMMRLALAESLSEVHLACADKETGQQEAYAVILRYNARAVRVGDQLVCWLEGCNVEGSAWAETRYEKAFRRQCKAYVVAM